MMPYLYTSFSANEPRAHGDGALQRAVAARSLDRTRVRDDSSDDSYSKINGVLKLVHYTAGFEYTTNVQ